MFSGGEIDEKKLVGVKGAIGSVIRLVSGFDHQATYKDVGRYDSREGGGRVAPGAATENNAGDRRGRWKLEQRRSSCRSDCRDGGNAERLLETISAMHTGTIPA